MDSNAPQLLNVLRVCDIPDVLGLIAPRQVVVLGMLPDAAAAFSKTATIFDAANHPEQFVVREK